MTSPTQSDVPLIELDLPLERDVFLRSMLRELSGSLQDIVGLDEASGFISLVGQRIGDQLNEDYRTALGVSKLTRNQVAEVLVDLKRRINGGFSIEEVNDDHIVLTNTHCPFAEKVAGRPALCMMTSNVFGSITADNLGYARVDLQETIADGAPGCRVVIHLKLTQDKVAAGREYFRG
ncbi:transcriptional regulator [Pseudohongiella acticola]|uniref:Transcriptional regulator n=1 Tax=Pseudohongiella acticola TaxID=1524254 RepID=A0A1E8CM64_9GAMM|nr:methanogen output domain 1-containing protein [Pseudohongiella acticola]OFE13561.1 transcriptional regulator [Pseudohongiella acticola]